MNDINPKPVIHVTGDATGFIPAPDNKGKPINVIGTKAIRDSFDAQCLIQAQNARSSPGVTDVVLNPDAHVGYGAPIGCVMVSPTHIYPGPVGVDVKCSMSLLQLNLDASQINDKSTRRALINAIGERVPTGAGRGQREVKKSRRTGLDMGRKAVIEGASEELCQKLGIPYSWAHRCEDSFHRGHDNTRDSLAARLEKLVKQGKPPGLEGKLSQLGSYGGGNHFGECEVISVADNEEAHRKAEVFGLNNGGVAFLSHCGSRGFGNILATNQFKTLQQHFARWNIPLPGNDRELVYAVLGTPEANDYLDDMALGANFATVNHLLINALVLEAFQEVIPGVQGHLVYFISHNIARQEPINNRICWVHRKGATRAFPAGHPALANSPFYKTGHPILLLGNPTAGSVVMAANPGAEFSCYSVNHGAGRAKGRKSAIRDFDQKAIDSEFIREDILTNCREYPKDEAPAAYKDFREVLRSVEQAGLASTVAHLKARFVIKDADAADD